MIFHLNYYVAPLDSSIMLVNIIFGLLCMHIFITLVGYFILGH